MYGVDMNNLMVVVYVVENRTVWVCGKSGILDCPDHSDCQATIKNTYIGVSLCIHTYHHMMPHRDLVFLACMFNQHKTGVFSSHWLVKQTKSTAACTHMKLHECGLVYDNIIPAV